VQRSGVESGTIVEFKEIKISLDFFVSFLCQDKNEKTSKKPKNKQLSAINNNQPL